MANDKRVATVFAEVIAEGATNLRVPTVFVESIGEPTTLRRVPTVFAEIIVGAPLGWTIGVIEF